MSNDAFLQFCQSRPVFRDTITTGKWRCVQPKNAAEDDQTYWQILSGNGYFDDEGRHGFCLSGFINKADASLIAAAPKLLEALQEISDSHIPDNPAASAYDDLAWAQRHVGRLRRIAFDAIKAAGAP